MVSQQTPESIQQKAANLSIQDQQRIDEQLKSDPESLERLKGALGTTTDKPIAAPEKQTQVEPTTDKPIVTPEAPTPTVTPTQTPAPRVETPRAEKPETTKPEKPVITTISEFKSA